MPGPNLRPAVLAARDKLRKGREKLKTLHASGAPGIQVSTYLTDLVDAICLDLYQSAWADLGGRDREAHLALVAHGGYGRRDVAPFSDVDLMMLLDPGTESQVRPLAQRLTQDICDAGLMLGFSLRTTADACQLALTDATVFTSLAESRFLAGHEPLFTRFLERLRRVAARNSRSLIRSIEESRREERHAYGETNFLLMPNIKRSLGGLRDIQLVRWVGFARYGNTAPEVLEGMDAISPEDRRRLRRAQEFLLRLRNELHFHAGRSQDVLDRQEQVRLAKLNGYKGDEGLLPVEQFMRDYFHHTSEVKHAMTHFLAAATARVGVRSLFNSVMSHDVEGDFRVGPIYISATQRGLVKVRRDLVHVLRLMDLANLYDKMIEHHTWEAIREAVQQRATISLTREVAERFLSLISQPGRLGDLLRRLHELRVLEQIIPGMSHARCLLQFNEFHKYTVDEHSIRAVEEAVRFFDDPRPIGEAYRTLRNKRLLHLALLIHDMGKGNPEDHSEVGAQLADETARRLGLPEREGEILRFLVHRHLMMSDLAQFRDTHDPDVVVDLAVEVGSPEVLQMLYVMTAADWAAVGPGVLTDWKLDLLTQLYLNARRHLTGEISGDAPDAELVKRRAQLQTAVRETRKVDDWWRNQLDALPPAYLFAGAPREIVDQLEHLRSLSRHDATAWGRYLPDRRAVEYTIGTYEDITPGIFHRLTGVLTSQRLEILSAEIQTLADGLVLDRFHVQDRDFAGEPPPSRVQEVCAKLTDSLRKPTDQPPKFPSLWGTSGGARSPKPHRPASRVRIDNATSDRFTILDIFALDRMGLLYTITRQLYELGLSVHKARIGSHLDQVVDVFYVTNGNGQKISDEQTLTDIRSSLLKRIEQLEQS
jgi:[protein-PII] uridylyltransferase